MEMSHEVKMFLTFLFVTLATCLVGLFGAVFGKDKVSSGAAIAIFVESFVIIGYLIYSIWK